MKGFYWGSGVVRCGFCGHPHHNITTCKHVDKYADLAMDKIAKIPDYICTTHEHRALMEIKRREERKVKARKPKRKPRCSYCGSYDHKRPKCNLLKQFRQDVYTANKNWKQLFSKRINELGLGAGSLIEIYGEPSMQLGFNVDNLVMIIDYNLSNLNVFCALGDYNTKYQSNTTVEVLSGGKTDNISIKYLGTLIGHDLFNAGWWYRNHDPPKVITPMPWEPEESWLNSEWDEVLNWFFKDVRLEEAINSGLNGFIEEWKNKI